MEITIYQIYKSDTKTFKKHFVRSRDVAQILKHMPNQAVSDFKSSYVDFFIEKPLNHTLPPILLEM